MVEQKQTKMNVEIQIYRGWSISFNTESKAFYCHSEQYDKDQNKKSYSSTKKWIDDFIKDNQEFKSIWVEKKPNTFSSREKIRIIGIRKDQRLIYEGLNGAKKQLSDYDEKKYILYNPENDKFREQSELVDKEIGKLREKQKQILSNIKGIELTEYKKILIQESP